MIISNADTRFRERLATTGTLAAAGRLLAECSAALGWERAAFNADMEQTHLPLAEDGAFVALTMGWSPQALKHWVDDRMARSCPVTRRCGRSMDAFLWEADPDSESWRGEALSDIQRQTLSAYRDWADGAVTVPVHRPGGKTGYVSWFGHDPDALKRRHRDTWRETWLISHAFIAHADALESATRKRSAKAGADTLTLRELECLAWAARGKTDEDIGQILGRSRETVHFHLGKALKKLGASNRTHAVAIACALGLIHLF